MSKVSLRKEVVLEIRILFSRGPAPNKKQQVARTCNSVLRLQ